MGKGAEPVCLTIAPPLRPSGSKTAGRGGLHLGGHRNVDAPLLLHPTSKTTAPGLARGLPRDSARRATRRRIKPRHKDDGLGVDRDLRRASEPLLDMQSDRLANASPDATRTSAAICSQLAHSRFSATTYNATTNELCLASGTRARARVRAKLRNRTKHHMTHGKTWYTARGGIHA